MRELRRDAAGANRVQQIDKADFLLRQARIMGAAWTADPKRGFADFGDDSCEICPSVQRCGMKKYEEFLTDAAAIYRNAGLSTLSDRVDAIRHLPPPQAWEQFDEANAVEGLS